MQSAPWDETWHRLREWTAGQGPSERLAALLLVERIGSRSSKATDKAAVNEPELDTAAMAAKRQAPNSEVARTRERDPR
jgi:hypothetical protein